MEEKKKKDFDPILREALEPMVNYEMTLGTSESARGKSKKNR